MLDQAGENLVDQRAHFRRQLAFALEQQTRHAVEQRVARKPGAVFRQGFHIEQLAAVHVVLGPFLRHSPWAGTPT